MTSPNRVVVGVSGASGAALAVRVMEILSGLASVETHLVISDAARETLHHEVGAHAVGRLLSLSNCNYKIDRIGAEIASGSFPVSGMIVVPCSMRTLSAIACGSTENLLTRAADVQLKERRKLVLLARETPLHLGHLRNMVSVTEMGAIVMPPVPAFYQKPQSVGEIIDHIAARAIDLLRLPVPDIARPWNGGQRQGSHRHSAETDGVKAAGPTISGRASSQDYADVEWG